MTESGPNIEEIRAAGAGIAEQLLLTPMMRCPALEDAMHGRTQIVAKLEFLQRTGTFKARAAMLTLNKLSDKERRLGVTAVSAGNHAIATAFAANAVASTAKIVMIRSKNRARLLACQAWGAQVVMAENAHKAFERVAQIQQQEGRRFVHPFEGKDVALGTGTLGLEICEQADQFDALIVPVGGGGLIAGVANAVKRLCPQVEVIGVEPEGADSMHRSMASGAPESIGVVNTIADSLGAPFALPYSFELARKNVDRLVLVNDRQLRQAMKLLFHTMNVAVEAACAATTAALLGPLRDSMQGKRVVLLMCGSNIDWKVFSQQAMGDNVD